MRLDAKGLPLRQRSTATVRCPSCGVREVTVRLAVTSEHRRSLGRRVYFHVIDGARGCCAGCEARS